MTPLDRLRTLVARLVATEPVVLVATGVAVLGLVGIQVAEADAAALTRVLVVVLPLVGGAIARHAVTPTARAAEAGQQAVADTLSALADGDLDPYLHLPTGEVGAGPPTLTHERFMDEVRGWRRGGPVS